MTVMAALDLASAVKTEQWITGPDGERDKVNDLIVEHRVDVEIISKGWQYAHTLL